jgi:fructokinase
MDTRTLVIGEALIDIVEGRDGAGEERELVGGSPANVAVGLARQGHAVQLLTRIGRDERGARIAEHVAASGAALAASSWTDGSSSTARARLRADGSAEYLFDIDWTIPEPALDGVTLVHSGSIALFLEPGGRTVLDPLQRAAGSALVTLDPNIRPALVGDRRAVTARFARAAASADLVKLSDEDAAWLYPGLVAEQVLAEIATCGPRVVVMTRGAEGAVALGPSGILEVPAVSVEVVDTIGAGDAYMASLISSALDDPQLFGSEPALRRALRRAAITAAITVSRAGANPPTRREVDAAF